MCGIHVSVSTRGFQHPCDNLKQLLSCRGPDHTGDSHITIEHGSCYCVSALSTVLALRGDRTIAQPFVNGSGSILCWNGEAWSIGTEAIEGNDGQLLSDLLREASLSEQSVEESTTAILKVFRSTSGPFAFVFVDMIHHQIYFGRDRLGRRSLLYKIDEKSESIHLSSVADPSSQPWQEVDADAIYQLSCTGRKEDPVGDGPLSISLGSMSKHFWETQHSGKPALSLGTFNTAHPSGTQALSRQSESLQHLRRNLLQSLKLRVLNVPLPPGSDEAHHVRIAVLFSGGLDCTVLARMAHEILPLDQQIDLLNVAFENPRVVKAAKDTAKGSNSGKKAARKERARADPDSQDIKTESSSDCSPFEVCPDRETGRKAVKELQNVCPGRVWRFVAIDIPYTETMAHRNKVVNLIHPHNTEMDLSIAFALYFAARGSGLASVNPGESPVAYCTPARVLLSGLGADELLGGYTRHGTAFHRRGFTGLLDELKLDVDRLGKRNLGRDDRVISHWGREARFPYLDENLVKWAVECPIWEKCGFQTSGPVENEVPDLEPGKKVLRLLAYELGMHSVAQEKKRAIQFGARTAKMEVGNTKGTALIS